MKTSYKLFAYRILTFIDRKHRLKWLLKCNELLGMKIGKETHVFSNIGGSEPYLIEIGDFSTIATNVSFITHDASIGAILGREKASDLVGKIIVGNHVFIGSNSTILYGCSIGDNSIIAAGSVVTKSVPSNVVVGGNPAKYICNTDKYIEKHNDNYLSLHGKSFGERKHLIIEATEKQIRRGFLQIFNCDLFKRD